MSKHTLGPWEIAPPHQTTGWGLCIRSSSRILARMVGRDQDQKKADARLMVAAPDLLSVCKELADSAAYWSEYDVPLGIVDRLNAAIAKAEEI